jgi:hypothetical protein
MNISHRDGLTHEDYVNTRDKLAVLFPPNTEVISQRIATLSHREKGFALIAYNESCILFENKWFPVCEKSISLLERMALKEFALADEGFDEYKLFLQFKYGDDVMIGSKAAILAFPSDL